MIVFRSLSGIRNVVKRASVLVANKITLNELPSVVLWPSGSLNQTRRHSYIALTNCADAVGFKAGRGRPAHLERKVGHDPQSAD